MSKLIKFKRGIYQNPTHFLVDGVDKDIKPNFGSEIQQGTPFSSENFNVMARQISYTVEDISATTNLFTVALEGLEQGDLADNLKLLLVPNSSNTGACNINPQSLGSIPIKKQGNINLVAGDIVRKQQAILNYSEEFSCFELLNPQSANKQIEDSKTGSDGRSYSGLSDRFNSIDSDVSNKADQSEVDSKANQSELDDLETKSILKENSIINIEDNVVNATAGGMAILNNVARFNEPSGSIIGTLKITFPKDWSKTMMKLKLDGLSMLSPQSPWNLEITAFNNSTPTEWQRHGALLSGQAPFSKVRLGRDSATSKGVILLGDLTTNWGYSKISIDFISSFLNYTGWEKGWNIEVITDEAGITNIVEPTLQQNFNIANYGNKIVKSSSFTITNTESNTFIPVTSTATITVPNDPNIPDGTQLIIMRGGTGDVTFIPASGVTLSSKDNNRKIDGRYAFATLIKSTDTTWYLSGALTT